MMRSGRYVQQIEGYSAFIPAPLPPEPPIKMDAELHRLLSNKFVEIALLQEVTGWQRNRLYRYKPYLDLFESSYSLINPDNSDSH